MLNCLFCNIIRDFAPADRVHENDDFIAITDLYPVAPTHLLVIPRVHARDLDSWVLADNDSAAMLNFVEETARRTKIDGAYRLITNVGAKAGQGIFHLHWHMLSGDPLAAF